MIINKILKVPALKKVNDSLRRHYSKREIQRRECLEQAIFHSVCHKSVWLHTLMKSGTTYTLLFLANYLNYVYGDKKRVDYDKMVGEFFWHSFESTMFRKDLGRFLRDHFFSTHSQEIGFNGVIHSHLDLNSDNWKKAICLYRNPLDYVISSYFFHYINRGIKVSHPREILIPKLEEFISAYKIQLKIIDKRPDDVIHVAYEDLIRFPEQTFHRLISFLEIEVDENAIAYAIDASSKKRVQQMESQRGQAIVQNSGTAFQGSFVRSGKVGEWKEYFNDDDLAMIQAHLSNRGVELSKFAGVE